VDIKNEEEKVFTLLDQFINKVIANYSGNVRPVLGMDGLGIKIDEETFDLIDNLRSELLCEEASQRANILTAYRQRKNEADNKKNIINIILTDFENYLNDYGTKIFPDKEYNTKLVDDIFSEIENMLLNGKTYNEIVNNNFNKYYVLLRENVKNVISEPRYEVFLKKIAELKKSGNFSETEKEIFNIFLSNCFLSGQDFNKQKSQTDAEEHSYSVAIGGNVEMYNLIIDVNASNQESRNRIILLSNSQQETFLSAPNRNEAAMAFLGTLGIFDDNTYEKFKKRRKGKGKEEEEREEEREEEGEEEGEEKGEDFVIIPIKNRDGNHAITLVLDLNSENYQDLYNGLIEGNEALMMFDFSFYSVVSQKKKKGEINKEIEKMKKELKNTSMDSSEYDSLYEKIEKKEKEEMVAIARGNAFGVSNIPFYFSDISGNSIGPLLEAVKIASVKIQQNHVCALYCVAAVLALSEFKSMAELKFSIRNNFFINKEGKEDVEPSLFLKMQFLKFKELFLDNKYLKNILETSLGEKNITLERLTEIFYFTPKGKEAFEKNLNSEKLTNQRVITLKAKQIGNTAVYKSDEFGNITNPTIHVSADRYFFRNVAGIEGAGQASSTTLPSTPEKNPNQSKENPIQPKKLDGGYTNFDAPPILIGDVLLKRYKQSKLFNINVKIKKELSKPLAKTYDTKVKDGEESEEETESEKEKKEKEKENPTLNEENKKFKEKEKSLKKLESQDESLKDGEYPGPKNEDGVSKTDFNAIETIKQYENCIKSAEEEEPLTKLGDFCK
jgi:hypothetical protein